jgi:hypothetical protein
MRADAAQHAAGTAMRGTVEDVPSMPVVDQDEIWFDSPFMLVKDGRYSLGWQRWTERKGGSGFVTLRRNSLGTPKIVERYPLNDEGWAGAWRALVRLDRETAEKALAVLADRTESMFAAQRRLEEDSRLAGSTLAFMPEVVFLGGYLPGAGLTAGAMYDARFLHDRLVIYPCGESQVLADLPYSLIESVHIGGPGLVRTGGGFSGGGFGVVGAAEGIAIAGILNALTSRTKIRTVVRVEATGAELFILNTKVEPDSLRISLSRALGSIRQARPAPGAAAIGPELPRPGSVVDELSRIAGMLESGLLSRQEFDQLKARLLAGG